MGKNKSFTVRVSEKLFNEFKEFCDENSMNISKRIRKYMENDVSSSKRRKLER
jgi:predicted DNA binding CopG/RHH family protein